MTAGAGRSAAGEDGARGAPGAPPRHLPADHRWPVLLGPRRRADLRGAEGPGVRPGRGYRGGAPVRTARLRGPDPRHLGDHERWRCPAHPLGHERQRAAPVPRAGGRVGRARDGGRDQAIRAPCSRCFRTRPPRLPSPTSREGRARCWASRPAARRASCSPGPTDRSSPDSDSRAAGRPRTIRSPTPPPPARRVEVGRADPRDGRRRLHRLASLRPAHRRGPRRGLPRQFLHRPAGEHRAPAGPSAVRGDAARRGRAALPRGGPDLQPRLSRLADSLPVQPGQDGEVERDGRDQHARARQAGRRPHPPGLDVRGLRRSHRAPADRDLLGQREPDRSAVLLRRRQAGRRDADDGLPPGRPGGHPDRAHLQHVRHPDAGRATAASSPTSSCRRCGDRS